MNIHYGSSTGWSNLMANTSGVRSRAVDIVKQAGVCRLRTMISEPSGCHAANTAFSVVFSYVSILQGLPKDNVRE